MTTQAPPTLQSLGFPQSVVDDIQKLGKALYTSSSGPAPSAVAQLQSLIQKSTLLQSLFQAFAAAHGQMVYPREPLRRLKYLYLRAGRARALFGTGTTRRTGHLQ
jgi:hypothetical protein